MTEMTDLFDAASHEPLVGTAWNAERVRAAMLAIVSETEHAFSPDTLWPVHPLDEEEGEPPLAEPACLYLGAAGVIWALHALERTGAVELTRAWADVAATLLERYLATPDFPEDGVMPSLWLGESGILLVAHTLAPSRAVEERLLEVVRANVAHPALELVWGAPGTMLAADVMVERAGDPAWTDTWNASAAKLWAAWDDEVWHQDLGGSRAHHLGAAHGFAGNVFVLARGDLLDDARRAEPHAGQSPSCRDTRSVLTAARRGRRRSSRAGPTSRSARSSAMARRGSCPASRHLRPLTTSSPSCSWRVAS